MKPFQQPRGHKLYNFLPAKSPASPLVITYIYTTLFHQTHQYNLLHALVPMRTSTWLIKANDFKLSPICPHENSLNPVLPSLGA